VKVTEEGGIVGGNGGEGSREGSNTIIKLSLLKISDDM
jgi:hypothetical protein